MTEHLISIKDFADQQGLYRQTVFKVIKRLEIEPAKLRGGKQNRGQTISYITEEDAQRLLEALASSRRTQDGKEGRDFFQMPSYMMSVFSIYCA
ncbi:hypothetical protein G9409_04585 [Chlorobium sp. BLA1]|uniref:hypothetical protein n=1 Tax=Candidatus Chlorobium masyuteum TaxID=2716876 RepID=UPI00142070D1|nr:hypothetical protein [Candidatus Chlorobium masyuteum]NHQ59870.1 hypothetical protein [Candidatus Chlorobium masyuteum]